MVVSREMNNQCQECVAWVQVRASGQHADPKKPPSRIGARAKEFVTHASLALNNHTYTKHSGMTQLDLFPSHFVWTELQTSRFNGMCQELRGLSLPSKRFSNCHSSCSEPAQKSPRGQDTIIHSPLQSIRPKVPRTNLVQIVSASSPTHRSIRHHVTVLFFYIC